MIVKRYDEEIKVKQRAESDFSCFLNRLAELLDKNFANYKSWLTNKLLIAYEKEILIISEEAKSQIVSHINNFIIS